jgi:hypothetical protein
VVGGSTSTLGSLAGIYTRNVAGMGSEGSSGRVGFPDIHLIAAGSIGHVQVGLE